MSELRSRIAGVGGYVPPKVVTNQDLQKFMETTDEWIVQRSGIKERRWVEAGQNNTDLSYEASIAAIQDAGLDPKQIDLIVFATLNPDFFFPGNGVFLQERLGLQGIPAIDLRQQCSGFLYSMSVADHFIRLGTYQNVLVVGSEIHSRGLDKSTRGRDVTVLFGDGAGAVVMSATHVLDRDNDAFVYSTHLHADGRGAKNLWVPAPGPGVGGDERIDRQMLEEGLHYPKMEGRKVFMEAVVRMAEALREALEFNSLPMESVDLFLFHQANLRINEAVADQLKIPRKKVFNTIEKYGNTTAATIPLGMAEAIKAGQLQRGMRVAMAAFGSGYTWASALMRY